VQNLLGLLLKFLILQRAKNNVSLESWAKLLPLQFAYFDRLEKEKVLEVTYHLVGQRGSMLVVNVNSDEELSKIIGEDPMFFECKREIYPLTSRRVMEKQVSTIFKH
jgi:hypothetical protein